MQDNQRRWSRFLNGNIKNLFLFFGEKRKKICIQNTIELRMELVDLSSFFSMDISCMPQTTKRAEDTKRRIKA